MRGNPEKGGRHIPGLEEPKTTRRKLYVDSSRLSVRQTIGEWKVAAAERRSVKIGQAGGVGSMFELPKLRRPSLPEKPKPTTSRRSSSATPRLSLRRESQGPVVVTRFPQPSARGTMTATQIETARGNKLSYHPPVRASAELQEILAHRLSDNRR
ncbi:hypothetical protein KR044_004773 [Drosophila immigrans]|nr:hypothetical protein KR044_004773 [Drosophila immigrans]